MHAMFQTLLDACGTKSPKGRHLRCNKNIVCKISHLFYILDINIRHHQSCMHEHMTRLNAYVHTNNSPHHHQSFSIYAFTNTCHICNHQQHSQFNQYMYSPTTSQSINIYAFTNNISINQHICIHQYQLLHLVQHTTSHNPSKE